jgi:hypothetical protein
MKLLLIVVMISLSPALSQREGASTREVQSKKDTYSRTNNRENLQVFLSPYNHEAAANSYGISSRMMKLKYYC